MKTKKYKYLKLQLFVFCFSVFSINAQTYTYLAYDGFQWANNLPLNASSGGSGWSAPWNVQRASNNVPGYQFFTGSLNYNSLKTLGNKAC